MHKPWKHKFGTSHLLYRMKQRKWRVHVGIAHALIGNPDLIYRFRPQRRFGWITKRVFINGVYYSNWIFSMDRKFGKYSNPGSNLADAVSVMLKDGTFRRHISSYQRIG